MEKVSSQRKTNKGNNVTMAGEKTFRDRLTTNDSEGGRIWVYPKKPKGRLTNYRNWVSYVLLGFMFSAPFIKVNGNPLLLFDIINRKFVLFGKIFWPQDFFIIVFIFITAIVGLVLFTVVFGRIFCGWACPQTIFMEMLFRKIEYLIEGDYTKQKALANAPWTSGKIFKKTLKHFVFAFLSFLIGNVFLAYIIGSEELFNLVTESPAKHVGGFTSMIAFSGAFYFIFAWMREQVCTMACPYGRLQGVLMDTRTIVVAYDHKRGEPRGRLKKGEDRTFGSCIDCKQCVNVCPTGIDIRQGTQLECINCTACIDACDAMMIRTDQPTGLVRYASREEIITKTKFRWTPRVYAYIAVLIIMMGVIGYMFMERNVVQGSILRGQNTTFQQLDNDIIRNVFKYNIINKSYDAISIEIKLLDIPGELTFVGGKTTIDIPSAGMTEGVILVDLKRENVNGTKTPIVFGLYDKKSGELIETMSTKFAGPGKYDM